MPSDPAWRTAYFKEKEKQAALLRDVLNIPDSRVRFNARWLTRATKALAETIYAERAFERMPILGDALEEVGCDNTDILDHCRGGGPHVRGCWVVDLLLGKN